MPRMMAVVAIGVGAMSVSAQYGRSAYDFLNIPTSAHATALGGSAIALVDDDLTLADQNPALLGPEIDGQISFNYMLYLSHGNFAGLRYGHAAGDRGAWAAGIRYLNYGSLTRYDQNGIAGDKFKTADIVFEGSYSHDFTDRLRGGINLKMVYSNYDAYTAFAMAADLGLNYYDEEHDLSLSALIKNAGGQLKRFNTAYTRLPFDIQLGYMQGLGSGPFSLAITATNLTRWRLPYYSHPKGEEDTSEIKSNFGSNLFRHLIFGLQYQPSDKFWAAISYNYKTRTDMGAYKQSFFSGISLGLGFKVSHLRLGIAYGMPHSSASNLSLNLSYSFESLMQ